MIHAASRAQYPSGLVFCARGASRAAPLGIGGADRDPVNSPISTVIGVVVVALTL